MKLPLVLLLAIIHLIFSREADPFEAQEELTNKISETPQPFTTRPPFQSETSKPNELPTPSAQRQDQHGVLHSDKHKATVSK